MDHLPTLDGLRKKNVKQNKLEQNCYSKQNPTLTLSQNKKIKIKIFLQNCLIYCSEHPTKDFFNQEGRIMTV